MNQQSRCILPLVLYFLWTTSGFAGQGIHRVAVSFDEERIAYTVFPRTEEVLDSSKNRALVFIHGWCCDSRYWHNQVQEFSSEYTVLTIDLAGHGNSSPGRKNHSMQSYAKDVQAVLSRQHVGNAILIGHSLGGGVIVQAACLMPETVIGIIGVDTLHNVGETIPQAQLDGMAASFETDFVKGMHDFVAPMFPKGTDKELVHWVREDMASASPAIALSAFKNYLGEYVTGVALHKISSLSLPVVTLNARLWPTDLEGNARHISNYTALFISKTGHFPMLERPRDFTVLLAEAIRVIERQR